MSHKPCYIKREVLAHANKIQAEVIGELRAENFRLTDLLAKKDRGIEDFHRSECGCLDWRRDVQCMTLYKLTALALTPAIPKPGLHGRQ